MPYFLKDNREQWKDLSKIQTINKQVIDKTVGYSSTFDDRAKRIAAELGIKVTPVNIKSERRIIEKAINAYDGDIAKVNDIIRNTFIATESEIPSVLAAIEKHFKVIEYKQQSDNTGYTGHLFKVLLHDRIKGEVQVNTPQMIYGKESNAKQLLGARLFNEIKEKSGLPHGLGHQYYEKSRVLSAAEKQSAKGRELAEKSRKYYESIRTVKL